MNRILQTASTEIDNQTGFRYRSVYVKTENSKLHYHDYYEIFLTLSSEIKHLINGTVINLSRGALVFIRKEDTHYYYTSENSDLSFINIAFNEESLNQLFSYLTPGFCSNDLLSATLPPTVYLSEQDIKWLMLKIEDLNSVLNSDTELLKYKLRVLLFRIFTQFFQDYRKSLSVSTNAIPFWLVELDSKMHRLENFSRPPQHMVELSQKSRTHLGRVIKQYYGVTIPEYIYEIRLNYMANSLITTDNPVLSICYECGFENISWAYKQFKNKYGTTPNDFRKRNK